MNQTYKEFASVNYSVELDVAIPAPTLVMIIPTQVVVIMCQQQEQLICQQNDMIIISFLHIKLGILIVHA